MSPKEKERLLQEAAQLYALGLTVEKCRQVLKQLVESGVPYNSLQMKMAVEEFKAAENDWKRLEQEHLKHRGQLGVEV